MSTFVWGKRIFPFRTEKENGDRFDSGAQVPGRDKNQKKKREIDRRSGMRLMISPLLRGQSGCPADQTAEVVAPPKSCLLRHLPDRQTGRPQQFKCPFETAGLQIGDRRLAGCPADKPVDRGTMNSHGVGQSVDIEITVSAFALDPVETLFGERIRRIVIPGVSPHPHQKLGETIPRARHSKSSLGNPPECCVPRPYPKLSRKSSAPGPSKVA